VSVTDAVTKVLDEFGNKHPIFKAEHKMAAEIVKLRAILKKLRAPSHAVCEEAELNYSGYDWPILLPMIVAAAEREVKEDAS
jgi:hypothetical protein